MRKGCPQPGGGRAPAFNSARARLLLIMAAVALLVLVTFRIALFNRFTNWDDEKNIAANPYIISNPSLANLVHFWKQPYVNLYIPLTYTLFALEWWLGRGSCFVFHATNVLLHIAATWLVFAIVRQVLLRETLANQAPRAAHPETPRSTDVAAGFAAGFFAVHPVQTEVVSWVTAQKDLLGGLLVLASVACWVWRPYEYDPQRIFRANLLAAWRRDWVAALCFIAALLAKPSGVITPLFLLAVELSTPKSRDTWRFILVRMLPWLIVAIAWARFTATVQPLTDEIRQATPWPHRLVVAADALVFYAGKLVWPAVLLPVYGRTPLAVQFSWPMSAAAIAILVLTGTALLRGRALAVGAAWCIAGVLPTLGFHPFLYQAYSTVADRYLYLSMAGIALLIGRLFQQCAIHAKHRHLAFSIACLLLAVCGWRSAIQARIWQSSITLWTHTVHHGIEQAAVFNNLGNAYVELRRPREALAAFQRALELNPHHPEVNNNVGNLLLDDGLTTEAIAHFERALATRPDYAIAHANLGNALMTAGRTAEAMMQYRQAYALAPTVADIVLNYSLALLRQEQYAQALQLIEPFLQRRPDSARGWLFYGIALANLGHVSEALRAVRRSEVLDPSLATEARRIAAQMLSPP